MSTLAGQKIKDKYGNLLQVEGGVTTTLKNVEDGTGNPTALSVSASAVKVNALSFTSAPATSESELTALFIDGSNNIVKRDLNSSAFESSGVFEETFVGTTDSSISLAAAQTEIVPFSSPTNNIDSTSFHFGNSPAQFRLDSAAREYIENVSGINIPVFVDMSATVEVSSPNASITYTLQKWNGASWNNVKSVTRYKSSTGSQIDSFWGIFMLGSTERLRIQISSSTGGVALSVSSQFKFTAKETGNIL